MKLFGIGLGLIVLGVIAFFITVSLVESRLWTIPSIVLIFTGGGFELAAFVQAKRQMDETNRRFRQRSSDVDRQLSDFIGGGQ